MTQGVIQGCVLVGEGDSWGASKNLSIENHHSMEKNVEGAMIAKRSSVAEITHFFTSKGSFSKNDKVEIAILFENNQKIGYEGRVKGCLNKKINVTLLRQIDYNKIVTHIKNIK